GRSVGEALRFYKLGTDALTVFHDELDLAPFKVKVRTGGGLAGHNGLRSIDKHLGPDFRRVRIGIGHPGHKDRVTGHVLGNYAKAEVDGLADMLGAISAEADWRAKGEDTRFMNDVAARLQDWAFPQSRRHPDRLGSRTSFVTFDWLDTARHRRILRASSQEVQVMPDITRRTLLAGSGALAAAAAVPSSAQAAKPLAGKSFLITG